MQKKQVTFQLLIADYSIKLFSESNIELEDGYLPFLNNEPPLKADIEINCTIGLPDYPFNENDLVFEAKNESQKFYSIYRTDKKLGFVVYNQQTKDEIQQIAFLNPDFTKWEVFSTVSNGQILPLKYPLGPIILHYMTINSDAVMMHASCAFDGKKARLFTGFSGVGKSTISKIMSDAGHQIINDDRVIIRKKEEGYFVYNTPMYYRDYSKVAPLSAIYVISHSPENKIKKLNGAAAISKVMAFSIQNNFDKSIIQNRLHFFNELCSKISVNELGFVPNESVVKFILAHETENNS
ncbi:MAG: phosphoenolpyruvate carboxykinase (ATP) [Paludibacter sp.]|nr:phosphoenolpyruvate carboxykinase (ATP) [Paludibacter sp.]